MKRLIAALVLAVAGSAQAGTGDLAFVFNDSGQIMSVVRGALPGTFSTSLELGSVTAASTAGNFVATGTATIAGPAGALPVTVARTVSGLAVAGAIGAQVAKGVAPVAIGLAAYDLYSAYKIRSSAGGGLEADLGAAKVPITCTGYSNFGGAKRVDCLTAKAACDMRASQVLERQSGFKRGRLTGSGANLRCVQETSIDQLYWNAFNSELMGNPLTITGAEGCAPVVDALTGDSYTPGTFGDNKCITGRYSPVTLGQAAGIVAAAMTVEAVKSYIKKGGAVDPVPSVGAPTITGPASQNGAPATTTTTSTAANGTVTTINNTSTPVYNYTYGGNTISVDNSVRTTTTTNVGGSVTTTETKADTPTDPQCKEFPNSLACLQLGELQDSPITPVQKSVTVAQESIDLPSGCPADIALPGGRVISYATACDSAVKMAPLVIAAGVLSALLIAVAAIRSN